MKKCIALIVCMIFVLIECDEHIQCKTQYKTFQRLQKCKTPQLDSCKIMQVITLTINYLKY
jgi:hypothetical protein